MAIERNVLGGYLLHNYASLLTEDEWEEYKKLISRMKAVASEVMEKGGEVSLDPEMTSLISKRNRFLERVGTRIMKDHADEIHLNLCSRCGALTRTPKARQCVACGHDWH